MKKVFLWSVVSLLSSCLVVSILLFGPAVAFAQTNVAPGKAITASSVQQNYVATNANDNNTGTYWEGAPNTYPNTLTVDLGLSHTVSSVVLKLNPDAAWATRTQTLSVLGQAAGSSTWTTLKASATYTFDPNSSNTVTIAVSGTVQKLRLKITANTGSTGGQIAEFQIMGIPVSTQETYGNDGANWTLNNGAIIQAENYDQGGQGVAYNDSSSGNTGGAYRSENVDMEACGDTGGGYNVGWITNGEWLEYTVNATAGTYTITARVASNGSAVGDLQVLLDGAVLGTIAVDATGGWQTYVDKSISGIAITAGTGKILQLKAVNGGNFNVNYVKFATGTTTYALTVVNGSGSGNYASGTAVTITADAAPSGQIFDKWTGGTGTFANAYSATTTYTTTAADETITATYKIEETTYALTVVNGSGSGSYASGTVVSIVANAAPSGQVFDKWSGGTGIFGNVNSASTTYTTGASAATITASYKTAPSGTNIAIGEPIAASSVQQDYVATNANDDNVTTYWEGAPNAYPNTLTIDFGANQNITSIVLKLNPDAAWSTRTQTLQVLGHDQSTTSFSNLVSSTTYTFNPSWANTVTIPVTAQTSAVQLCITANTGATGGQVAEFQVIGTAAPNPDLIITGLSWTPTSPIETDVITLTAAVKNNGNASAAASSVNFYLGTIKVGTAATPVIAAGSSANVSVNIGEQNAGTYSVSAKADESNTLIELNNDNNSFTNTTSLVVSQVSSSDLVGNVSWNPSNPSGGNTVTFTVNLKNQGNIASASGAHDVTLVLKNSSGTTVKTFNGSYSGTLAAGASTNITMGTWTAVNGSYSLTNTVAVDANEVSIKQANNVTTLGFFVGRGANMPFTKIELEASANTTNGTRLTPNYNLADYAGEASGRSAVYLDATGEYVEFSLPAEANAFVLRNAVAEGTTGTISLYVGGTHKANFTVTSKYSYVYASPTTLSQLGYNNTPGGTAYWLYEDSQILLDTVYPAGTKIKIQKDSGDVSWIYLDLIETENVAPAASNPDPTKYVEVSASKSIDAALLEFRQDETKLGIFIPAGSWELSSKIFLYGRATEIIGAGPWHTKLVGPAGQTNVDFGFNIGSEANGSTIKDLSAWGSYVYRTDGPGKFIDGSGMQNVTVDNVWIEHFICMYWGVNASHNTFKNCRIRNTFADGVNMTNSSSYNTITNCDARACGDDAFALFSAVDAGGSYNVGNKYTNLTATCTRRAAAFAVYGGSDNLFQNLYGADTLTYPGITISSLSFGYNTLGFGDVDTVFDGITLDRCGGDFWTSVGADDKINDYQNFGAIWLFSGDRVFKNILVKNIDINNPVYFGLMFQCKSPENLPMQNVRLENININNAPRYGIKLVVCAEAGQGPCVGGASFTNVKINNPGIAAIYGVSGCPDFTVTKIGSDNNW